MVAKIFGKIVVSFFILFIVATFAGFLGGPDRDDILATEQREPGAWPSAISFDPGSPGRYLKSIEGFFQDRIICRPLMLQLYTHLHFVAGLPAFPGRVLISEKNKCLFLGNDYANCINSYRGLNPLTPAQQQHIIGFLTQWQEKASRRGSYFLFVMVPDKQSVYPEYLPEWVSKAGRESRRDQIVGALRASSVEWLDVAPALTAKKSTVPYQLYYRSDTHWNQMGAYVGFQEIIGRLARKCGEPGDFPDESVVFEKGSERKYQDLVRMGRLYGKIDFPMDDIPAVRFRDEPYESKGLILKNGDACKKISVTEETGSETMISVSVSNPMALTRARALIVHDSFIWSMSPFLNRMFSEVVYVGMVNDQHYLDVLDSTRPDVVIVCMVDRAL